MIEAAIALAVAAIPEGLPIVATVALARGMWRMAKRNAVVERLAAVETLGATTIICTDKTGTLTENRMTVEKLWLPSADYEVDHASGRILDASATRPARCATQAGASDRRSVRQRHAPQAGNGQGMGDPMELALLQLGALAHIHREALLQTWPEVHELAFDAETKMMATAHARDGALFIAIKGAPEAVLAAAHAIGTQSAPLNAETRDEWLRRAAALAEEGLRVLALAEKTGDADATPDFDGLVFLGLVGFRDPPRIEVKDAIAACQRAGIRVVMVTGDHAVTARKIAESLGIAARGSNLLVEGRELKALGALGEQERHRLLQAAVFARVTPAQKLDLVQLYQSAGEVVAMTGDGVNDAPALQRQISAWPWAYAARKSPARPPTSCSATTPSAASSPRSRKAASSSAICDVSSSISSPAISARCWSWRSPC